MDLLNTRHKFNMNFAGAGTIELAQEDTLPGPERNPATFDGDDYAGPDQARHEVAGAVPLTVRVIWLTAGDESLQIRDDVLDDSWIRILVDRHPGCCVGDEDKGKTIPSIFLPEQVLHLGCDLDELNRLI